MTEHRTDTNFIARLESISRDLKVLWIAQKVFSVHLEGKRRWVPLKHYDLHTKIYKPHGCEAPQRQHLSL